MHEIRDRAKEVDHFRGLNHGTCSVLQRHSAEFFPTSLELSPADANAIDLGTRFLRWE